MSEWLVVMVVGFLVITKPCSLVFVFLFVFYVLRLEKVFLIKIV